jgi:hypothetical protein
VHVGEEETFLFDELTEEEGEELLVLGGQKGR